MVSVIECWQSKVKRVEIDTRLEPFAGTGAPASVPVLKPAFDAGGVDPFAAYYKASRQRYLRGPHRIFADIAGPADISPFFEQFGFPSFHGRTVLVAEVLIEAKRLRLLMQAWEAYGSGNVGLAQQHLAELQFARGFQAHWHYWPPSFPPDISSELREHVSLTQQSLQWQFKAATQSKVPVQPKEQVYRDLVSSTWQVCVSPLTQVEFAPEIEPQDNGIGLRWSLRPVRFLGEEERGEGRHRELYVYEQPYIAAPYGLMYVLDRTAGVETRVCADPFCRKLFGVTRRGKKFCKYSCAHRVAVSNHRQRARASAMKGVSLPDERRRVPRRSVGIRRSSETRGGPGRRTSR